MTATGFRIRHGRHWTPVIGTRVSYTSAATAVADGLACRPGPARPAPGDLPPTQTAFACSGHSPLPTAAVSWNATITVTLTPDSLTGSYTATITHSVS